jgi:hypothetical protein
MSFSLLVLKLVNSLEKLLKVSLVLSKTQKAMAHAARAP